MILFCRATKIGFPENLDAIDVYVLLSGVSKFTVVEERRFENVSAATVVDKHALVYEKVIVWRLLVHGH